MKVYIVWTQNRDGSYSLLDVYADKHAALNARDSMVSCNYPRYAKVTEHEVVEGLSVLEFKS